MYTFQVKLRVFRKILDVISEMKPMKDVDFSLHFLKGYGNTVSVKKLVAIE